MPDLSLDVDNNRILIVGQKKYPNCLGFAIGRDPKGVGNRFVDACSSGMNNLDGILDLHQILLRVKSKIDPVCKRHWKIVGTSEKIPNNHAPDISRRRLIGVARENNRNNNGDLHFYVVTRTNGDGQGICGTLDALTNSVLPCRLRNRLLYQHQGQGQPQQYLLIGFFLTTLTKEEDSKNTLE